MFDAVVALDVMQPVMFAFWVSTPEEVLRLNATIASSEGELAYTFFPSGETTTSKTPVSARTPPHPDATGLSPDRQPPAPDSCLRPPPAAALAVAGTAKR